MASANHRNLAIDWLKGWMILLIVLVHTWAFHDYHFYLAVDVFFFISGYYLMLSYIQKPTTTVLYTWKRIKVIALPFFISLFFRCVMNLRPFFSPESYSAGVEKWMELLSAVSFAEKIGVNTSPVQLLTGSWFLSVLIIASFLIYGLLEFNKRLATRVLLPFIALLGYNAIVAHSEYFSAWDRAAVLVVPLVRGCTEMAAGALICSVYQENKLSFERHPVFINVMGIVSFVLFALGLFSSRHLDKYLIVTVPWILLAAVIDGSWLAKVLSKLRGGVMSRIGQYTLYILCAHYPALILANWCNEHVFHHYLNDWGLAVFGVLLVFPATFLLYIVCNWIRNHCRTKC